MGFGRRSLSGLGQGLSSVAGTLLSNRLSTQRQEQQNEQQLLKEMLDAFNADVKGLISPEHVGKVGPDAARTEFQQLRLRLPAAVRPYVGEEPDFTALDSTPASRMAPVRKRITDAAAPENIPGERELRELLAASRIDPEWSDQDSELGILANLLSEAESRKGALLAERNRTTNREPFTDASTGITSFLTEEEQGQRGSIKTGLTPAEEAAKQAGVTQATEQARTDVQNNPQNVRGFASREQAAAFARQMGQLSADKKMGAGSFAPQLEVIEDQDANGNKVYRVVDKRSGAEGPRFGSSVPSENVTDSMWQSYDYANRATAAHNLMMQLEPAVAQRGLVVNFAALSAPERIRDPLTRQYVQAAREYINAQARLESGAAISEAEYDRYLATHGYVAGDDETSLNQKREARRRVIGGLAQGAGNRLSQQFVSMAELEALAEQAGVPVQQKIQEAEAANYRVIR